MGTHSHHHQSITKNTIKTTPHIHQTCLATETDHLTTLSTTAPATRFTASERTPLSTAATRPPPLPLLRRVRPLRAWTPLVVETRSLALARVTRSPRTRPPSKGNNYTPGMMERKFRKAMM